MNNYERGISLKIYLIIAIVLLAGSAQATTLTVCPYGCDFSIVQAAINASKSGDTVEVHSGSYDHAVLTRNVTLHGIDTGGGKPHIKYIILCHHPSSLIKGDFGYQIFTQELIVEDLNFCNSWMPSKGKIELGYEMSIAIKTLVNNEEAISPPGPTIPIGDMITWTYEVKNSANTPLSDIEVTDSTPGLNPTYKSGDINGNGILDTGEKWIYTAKGFAIEGQHENIGHVEGTYRLHNNTVGGTSSSYYLGVATSNLSRRSG
jgi:uncharacterized repeat protein (TIGR01451 family)